MDPATSQLLEGVSTRLNAQLLVLPEPGASQAVLHDLVPSGRPSVLDGALPAEVSAATAAASPGAFQVVGGTPLPSPAPTPVPSILASVAGPGESAAVTPLLGPQALEAATPQQATHARNPSASASGARMGPRQASGSQRMEDSIDAIMDDAWSGARPVRGPRGASPDSRIRSGSKASTSGLRARATAGPIPRPVSLPSPSGMGGGTLPAYALNMVVSRIFFDLARNPRVGDSFMSKIQVRLDRVLLPSYVGPIRVVDLKMGDFPPLFSNVTPVEAVAPTPAPTAPSVIGGTPLAAGQKPSDTPGGLPPDVAFWPCLEAKASRPPARLGLGGARTLQPCPSLPSP